MKTLEPASVSNVVIEKKKHNINATAFYLGYKLLTVYDKFKSQVKWSKGNTVTGDRSKQTTQAAFWFELSGDWKTEDNFTFRALIQV